VPQINCAFFKLTIKTVQCDYQISLTEQDVLHCATDYEFQSAASSSMSCGIQSV